MFSQFFISFPFFMWKGAISQLKTSYTIVTTLLMCVHWWRKKLFVCIMVVIHQQGHNEQKLDPLMLPWKITDSKQTLTFKVVLFRLLFATQAWNSVQRCVWSLIGRSDCGYCSVYIENTQEITQRTKTGYTDKIETGWQPCFCKQSEVTHFHCKEEGLCPAPPFKGKAIMYPH